MTEVQQMLKVLLTSNLKGMIGQAYMRAVQETHFGKETFLDNWDKHMDAVCEQINDEVLVIMQCYGEDENINKKQEKEYAKSYHG